MLKSSFFRPAPLVEAPEDPRSSEAHRGRFNTFSKQSRDKARFQILAGLFFSSKDLYQRDKYFDMMWRRWDMVTCILTVAGFITATIDYERTYEYNFGHI